MGGADEVLGLNWTLANKKVASRPRKPLMMLRVGNQNQSWRGIESDFRSITMSTQASQASVASF